VDPTRPVNPYIAGSPVTGTEMFFGREDVFSFVRRNLTGRHRDTPIVLYGQRRTGKTSVLYQMHRHLDPRYRCIFIDLHGLNLNRMENLLWGLAASIRRGLQRDHQLNVAIPDRATFSANPHAAFETAFLDAVWSILGEDHLVLMIDEVVRLHEEVQAGRLEREVFDYLRYLMQHFERLNFVFSLGSGVEEMKKDYAFLFGVALYHRISFLEPMAARALITKPAQDCYRVIPDAAEKILQITSGHPYYTQLVCHCLFDRWLRAPKPQMTSTDVDAVLTEAIELGSANLTYVWEDSTPEEQAVMAGMAAAMPTVDSPATADQIREVWRKAGVRLPAGQAASAARNLTAREVVVASDGAYSFAVDLQRLWLDKHRRLDWVKQELEEPARRWLEEPARKQDRPADPAGEDMPRGPGPRAGGRLFPRRSIIVASAAAVAVIGLLIAIILIVLPGGGPTQPASRVRWTYTIPGNGNALNSGPAVAGGTVYIGSDNGMIYALDAVTGHKRWTQTTSGFISSSPAVAGGTVYIGSSDDKVYALDAATGAIRWTRTTGAAVDSSPAVVGGTVYVGSGDGKVYALDAATGAIRWRRTTGGAVNSSPAVVGGTVYVGSGDGKVYALDAATGAIGWMRTTGDPVNSSPAVVGGTVYVCSNDGNLYALDAATGQVLWNTPATTYGYSSPAVANDTVYIGSDDGNVYAFYAGSSQNRWSQLTTAKVGGSPAVTDGTVYITADDGKTYALDAATGHVLWTYTIDPGEVINGIARPAVVGGTVYVGGAGKVYALRAAP
jgi:outer membrane protein assembly factor BamB